ncbi:hypothetical protein OKA06_01865 [Novosphingobium sp. MW5]|nr:hypothetical protein [Novosphingobium sp. MW5]
MARKPETGHPTGGSDMTIRNETVLGAVLAILASTLGFALTLM